MSLNIIVSSCPKNEEQIDTASKPDALLLACFMLYTFPIPEEYDASAIQKKKKQPDLSHRSISVFYDSNFLKVEQSHPHTCFF